MKVTTWLVGKINPQKVNMVNLRVSHDLSLSQMVDGLIRAVVDTMDFWEDGYELPKSLSAKKIAAWVRESYSYHGKANVWTWSDDECLDADELRAWAERVIVEAIPGLDKNRG